MNTHLAPSSRAVLDLVTGLPSIDLETLQDRASLQERVDTKFIVDPATLRRVVTALKPDLQVLEINGERQFDYDSVYFDSPNWRTYRDHVQGRRRRFKARTRHYVGSDLCMFEVKVEGMHGQTIKHRMSHPVEDSDRLTTDARAHLDELLGDRELDERQIALLQDAIARSEAPERLEALIDRAVGEALESLHEVELSRAAVLELERLADTVAKRDR